MTSMNEFFKKPGLPSGSIKRKFEPPDPELTYKAAKLSSASSPNSHHANGVIREDGTENDNDVEAGPELLSEEEHEDQEGRFFGGGVTRDAAEAMDYIEGQEDGAETYQEEKIDPIWLRRLAVSFEKKVKQNEELRARYDGDPQKFMQSEADLDAEIRSWSLLSEHPELYGQFIECGAVRLLVGLLAHENTDISIGAIEIISELLDEDVKVEQDQWERLVTSFLDVDLMELLMSNLARLDEQEESDRSGVYHSLAVMESLASDQAVAEKVGHENVLNWLCERIRKPEKNVSQNKQYAAEVLQVLLQSSSVVRQRLALDVDGVDLFLQLLATYRKRDPSKNSMEEEYVENIFDALTCVVDEPNGKSKFVEAEGVELALIMLKEGNFSKLRALRLLDHACGGQDAAATEVCERLVDAAGLKIVFGILMKKNDGTMIQHLLVILASMLRYLPGESAARIRLLAKFTEKKYEKVTRLIYLRHEFARRVAATDKALEEEQTNLSNQEMNERADEFFSRRLDGGLFCLQTVDTILAWLIAEDLEAKTMILKEVQTPLIQASLTVQLQGLDPEANEDEDTREMLTTLMGCLDTCT